VQRPGIVHRLDKETSGCIVVAKNDHAHQSLAAQFASREVRKIYLAVVRGIPHRPCGTIEAAIARHPVHRQKMAVSDHPSARPARTDYKKLAEGKNIALLALTPLTGRTHQIRVHLKHLGHPILGDPVYGQRGNFARHFLHAWKLAFKHPVTQELMQFTAPVPPDFPLQPPLGC
jgi:23S rRNA pseudouridine1911/1915/1917 synthase